MQLSMTLDELNSFLDDHFPQVAGEFEVMDVTPMHLVTRANVADKHLRPGGTVSGPTMFALADVSVYLAILAMVGPKALAVTTNCAIDFMRKPAAATNLRGETRILKLGKVLAVGDVLIFSEGDDRPVARASMTYSIPPGP
ncbi:PaaI family thioesterase [Maritimibacter sp. DP1N21-5]|uniref:PaaI family thioesterase n=1 Tax=Maritimibacter sp. DP1N21-5 TaxID=2836867 RepID=UPI001C45A2A3|nr:PaaI family thioesterase [Maritimibacter sp. DP1N21-5]MBV7409877.1 PaaI family thioesterase [Maritimibacter sp. DP1N21-5]